MIKLIIQELFQREYYKYLSVTEWKHLLIKNLESILRNYFNNYIGHDARY